jgi:hypothetical protein
MEEKQFKKIVEQLNKITGILSIQNVDDNITKIKILTKLGMTSEEIGDVVGLHSTTVRRLRGKKGKRSKKK